MAKSFINDLHKIQGGVFATACLSQTALD